MNVLAISLVVSSYAAIFLTVVRSKKRCTQSPGGALRAHNSRIVRSAVLMTACTVLPWLPNFLLSLLLHSRALAESAYQTLGKSAMNSVLDASNYLYYSVPWIFPLINLLRIPNLCQSGRKKNRAVCRAPTSVIVNKLATYLSANASTGAPETTNSTVVSPV